MTGRRPAQGRVLVALLLLACILAGGMLAAQRAWPGLMVLRMTGDREGAQPARTPTNAATPGQRNTPPPPESRFAVIALRPLFTPGRRPAAQPDSPAATTAGGVPTGLLVTGIVMAGEDSVAIIEPERPGPQAKPAQRARVGDDVAGWTVEAIEPGRVVLARDGARHEMPLIDDDDPRRAPRRQRVPGLNQPRTAPSPVPGQQLRPAPAPPPGQSRPQAQPAPPARQPLKITP